MKSFKQITESSLSKIWKYAKGHDTGIITAFRSRKNCLEGEPITRSENRKRNRTLKALLLKEGYQVIAIKGVFIEGFNSDHETEVNEESFFVIDGNDTGDLKKDLVTFGEIFEQDAIVYADKNGTAYLISSNECPNGYPGEGKIGVKVKLGKPMFGKKGEFFSKVNGRPFVFEECLNPVPESIRSYFPSEIRGIFALAETVKK